MFTIPCWCKVENSLLWDDFRAGNREAYEELIRLYYQELYSYGMRLVGHSDFVKDCIHDVFVHVWERRGRLGDTDDPRLYLLKSLRNRIVKEAGKQGKQSNFDDLAPDLAEESHEDKVVAAEGMVLRDKKIAASLDQLTARQREVIHLRYFEGLPNTEVAEIMGISKPAVANLLHATLHSLRMIWKVSRFVFSFTIFS